jgi:protein-S-isoprenylcysteine O-methyltransferase Ste14
MRTELFLAGIALMWAGIAFRYYAMRVLGRYFTFQVDVHSGQTVIEAGPYRYIRHPSYTGALITVLGLGLALGNWAGILAMLVCIGIGYAYRIHVEEAALIAALGEPYKDYMRRTQRLVPFVL